MAKSKRVIFMLRDWRFYWNKRVDFLRELHEVRNAFMEE